MQLLLPLEFFFIESFPYVLLEICFLQATENSQYESPLGSAEDISRSPCWSTSSPAM